MDDGRGPGHRSLSRSGVLLFVSGVLQALNRAYSLTTGWIAAAIGLYVLTFVLDSAAFGPTVRRQLAEARHETVVHLPNRPDGLRVKEVPIDACGGACPSCGRRRIGAIRGGLPCR